MATFRRSERTGMWSSFRSGGSRCQPGTLGESVVTYRIRPTLHGVGGPALARPAESLGALPELEPGGRTRQVHQLADPALDGAEAGAQLPGHGGVGQPGAEHRQEAAAVLTQWVGRAIARRRG